MTTNPKKNNLPQLRRKYRERVETLPRIYNRNIRLSLRSALKLCKILDISIYELAERWGYKLPKTDKEKQKQLNKADNESNRRGEQYRSFTSVRLVAINKIIKNLQGRLDVHKKLVEEMNAEIGFIQVELNTLIRAIDRESKK
jgi:hypothetical protein